MSAFHLNSKQLSAIWYIDTHLLILAGAGSGKTSVITNKISYLIEKCGIHARHIIALTFTNKAAREMKTRVKKVVQGKRSYGLTVSTFHHFGLNFIRKEHQALGYKLGFSIFDATDSKTLIVDLIDKEMNFNEDQINDIIHRISNWKNNLITPDTALKQATDAKQESIAKLYQTYCQSLKAFNAVDFDDLILEPVKLLTQCPETRQRWQQSIHYILVDEYQDTNNAQYALIKNLLGWQTKLTVVGDDDQSIYAWRGARPENLSELKKDYPSLNIIKLEQNYRSSARILKVANTLIENNTHIFNKKLWSDLGIGEEIRVIKCKDEEAESERIATEILTQKLRFDRSYREYAVLYRSNFQSRLLEIKLQQHQIPYHINGGVSFFSRVEVKDIMTYLRLLINPSDDSAFLRIANIPKREIGATTLEKLSLFAKDQQINLYEACRHEHINQALPTKAVHKLQSFIDWLDNHSKRLFSSDNPIEIIRHIIHDSGYEAWLTKTSSSTKSAQRRMDNVWFLIDSLQHSMEKEQNHSLEEAFSQLILKDILERQNEEDDNDRVQLLTLHASKGLEYPHVFMMGMEEDILPHRTSIEDDNLEEERRLTYVGITRAKKTLTFTLSDKRKRFSEWVDTTPSRFLDELPQEDLQYIGFQDHTNEEQLKTQGHEALSMLKKSLLE